MPRVRRIYRRDDAARKFRATEAAIWGLAKVMLIKDEVYVSYLLTRYEKKQRDIVKYGVDVSNGDRLVYRHHTKPEVNLGPWKFRINITTRDWMLHVVRQCTWWRRLPGWHQREAEFRDWYVSLLDRVDLSTDASYEQALRVLKCPEEVSGYREIRYPKMDVARQGVEAELSSTNQPPQRIDLKPVAAMAAAGSSAA